MQNNLRGGKKEREKKRQRQHTWHLTWSKGAIGTFSAQGGNKIWANQPIHSFLGGKSLGIRQGLVRPSHATTASQSSVTKLKKFTHQWSFLPKSTSPSPTTRKTVDSSSTRSMVDKVCVCCRLTITSFLNHSVLKFSQWQIVVEKRRQLLNSQVYSPN